MNTDFDKIAESSRASIEKEDLKVLLPIISRTIPERILEIGMHQGYSMELWRKAFNPKTLIGIEINPPTPESYMEDNSWWNTDSHGGMVELPTFNFIFIDGDHSYKGVRQDFEKYSPLVEKGGIIAFHDALYHHDKTEEVDIFWNEIKKEYPYIEIKMSKNSTGIGLILYDRT